MNELTIYHCFRFQVEQNPERRAIFDERRSLTYRQLDNLVDTIVMMFPDAPSRIGVLMDHSVEMIASILAVLKAGAAYIPAEPDFPSGRIKHMMEEGDVDFVITQRKYAEKAQGFNILLIESGIRIHEFSASLSENASPSSLAYILYTSGSTGKPKGVAVENRNVCHYVKAFQNEFHPGGGDIMLQYSVCSFDIFVEEVFSTLLSGATLAIPSLSVHHDPEALVRFLSEQQITIVSGFPYLLLELNKLDKVPPNLRLLISGGDVLRAAYVDRLIKQVEIYNTYGPSETTVCVSYFRCNETEPLPDGTYPIGKAIPGSEMILIDENLKPVKPGERGEIVILGDGVSRGYIGRRKKENEAFSQSADGRRMYRSGDLGICLPDGNFTFIQRKDNQVMILGRRVETGEVENVLCNCRGIEQGVVIPYTDEQGLAYFVAYIVSRDSHFRLSVLKQEMGNAFPLYMMPEFFVRMQHLPLNANGKVDHKALPVVLKSGSLDLS